jgi:hypothetical protein
MGRTHFEYGYGANGWTIKSGHQDGLALASLAEPLFQTELRRGSVPEKVGFICHCQIGTRWCVVTKAPDHLEYRGVLWDEREYLELDFDPFRAALQVLQVQFVAGLFIRTERRRPARDVKEPVYVSDDPKYLKCAYECFLTSSLAERRRRYYSLLPVGLARAASPLTWFSAHGNKGADPPDWEKLFPKDTSFNVARYQPPPNQSSFSSNDERDHVPSELVPRVSNPATCGRALSEPADDAVDSQVEKATAMKSSNAESSGIVEIQARLERIESSINALAGLVERTLELLCHEHTGGSSTRTEISKD